MALQDVQACGPQNQPIAKVATFTQLASQSLRTDQCCLLLRIAIVVCRRFGCGRCFVLLLDFLRLVNWASTVFLGIIRTTTITIVIVTNIIPSVL